jgi:hypothetical protein
VLPELPGRFGDRRVVGDDRTAFATHDIFGGVERQAADVEQVAGRFVPVRRADCLAGILHHRDGRRRGYRANRFDVDRLAIQVDDHDGRGAIVDRRLGCRDVGSEVGEVDVDESHLSTLHQDGVDGSDEAEGRRDDLGTRSDTQRRERAMQGCGATRNRDGVRSPRHRHQGGLQTFDDRSGCEHSAAKDRDNLVDLGRRHVRCTHPNVGHSFDSFRYDVPNVPAADRRSGLGA